MRVIFILIFLLTGSFVMAANFTIQSNDFSNNGIFPAKYTCDGDDTSPALSWSNPPTNTKSFALILSDPDAPAGEWDHWILYNIPANVTSLENELPSGTLVGKNSWNAARYNGPCPPKGSKHHYYFTLYALDTILNLSDGENGKTVRNAIKNHIIQKTQVIALFGH